MNCHTLGEVSHFEQMWYFLGIILNDLWVYPTFFFFFACEFYLKLPKNELSWICMKETIYIQILFLTLEITAPLYLTPKLPKYQCFHVFINFLYFLNTFWPKIRKFLLKKCLKLTAMKWKKKKKWPCLEKEKQSPNKLPPFTTINPHTLFIGLR